MSQLNLFEKDKLIVSIYDYTGAWAKPYIDAGYPVMLWDQRVEGDIIKNWGTLIGDIENAVEAGYYPYGLLSAPPCTDFAVSGARHFAKKDASTVRCGYNDIASNTVDLHIILAEIVLELIHQVERLTGHRFKFWALENPVGRIERLVPSIKPFRKMLFNPCDYGDPYTKKTILWGEFNTNLIKKPVAPVHIVDSKRGRKYSVNHWSSKDKPLRSVTPSGFANAFFQANQ